MKKDGGRGGLRGIEKEMYGEFKRMIEEEEEDGVRLRRRIKEE